MEAIRIGIVGLGSRGAGWIHMLQSMRGYHITAICDPIVALHERARARLARPHEVTVYTRYEDVLADPNVDAIALCVRCKVLKQPDVSEGIRRRNARCGKA